MTPATTPTESTTADISDVTDAATMLKSPRMTRAASPISSLLVLDAKTLTPIARADLPQELERKVVTVRDGQQLSKESLAIPPHSFEHGVFVFGHP